MKKELLAVLGCGILAVGLASCDNEGKITKGEVGEVLLDHTNELNATWYDSEYYISCIENIENHTDYLRKDMDFEAQGETIWQFGLEAPTICITHYLASESYTSVENEEEVFYAIKVTEYEKYKEVIGIKDTKEHYAGDIQYGKFERNLQDIEVTYLYYQPKETFEIEFGVYHVFNDYTYEYIKDVTYTVTNLDYENEVDAIARAKAIHENANDYRHNYQ